ncbi:cysteine-rich transmembrane CYSTM domain-containing protein [Fusarium coicis]|nr:cysteine-rich transmembrane CYSTM domain-containing protein [Fusarium coicis]
MSAPYDPSQQGYGYPPPQGQYAPQPYPPQPYQQAPPPPQQEEKSHGCLYTCLATLCCCWLCGETCECCLECFDCCC